MTAVASSSGVSRRALVARLRAHRIGLVEAPGGFGKTTLAYALAEDAEITTVRITVEDAAGADAVVAACVRGLRQVGLVDLAETVASAEGGADGAVEVLTEALRSRGLPVLVHVDETQKLDAAGAAWVGHLLERLPGECSAVLTGRHLPDPLAAHRGRPDVASIGVDDLRFSAADIAQLIDSRSISTPDPTETVAWSTDLVRLTDGWPAAVALMTAHRLAAPDGPASGPRSLRAVMTYLLADLLAGRSAAERHDIGRLAAVPLLSAEVAEVVAGPGSLARAEAAGLPLVRRADGWLRLPDPIREALAGPPLGAALVLDVARLYAGGDALQAAVVWLHGLGAHDELVELLGERPWAQLETAGPSFGRVVLSLVGERAVQHPALLVKIAVAVEAKDRALRRAVLELAAQATTSIGGALRRSVLAEQARDASRSGDYESGTLLALAALDGVTPGEIMTQARALYAKGMADTLRCTERSLLDAGDALEQAALLFELIGEHRWTSEALARLGFAVSFHGGRVAHALDQMERALALLPAADAERAILLTYHMDVQDCAGLVDAAEASGREALATGLRLADETVIGYACWGLALVASHRGDHADTLRWLGETERHAGRWMDEPIGAEYAVGAVDMLASLGDETGARRYLDLAHERAEHHRMPDVIGPALGRVEAMYGDAEAADALVLALEDRPFAVSRSRWMRSLLRAYAAHRRGEHAVARRLYDESIELALWCGLPDLPARHERWIVARLAGAHPRVDASSAVVRVSLLGGFAVAAAAGNATPAPGHSATLVKLLALRGKTNVDEIIELLWPDCDATTGRARLRNLLNRVRSQSGEIVTRHGETLSLVANATVDARDFDLAACAALDAPGPQRAGLARAAVSMYDELLPADLYDDWAAAPRARLRRRFVALTDLLAADAEGRGDLDEAIRQLDLGMATEPHDEGRAVWLVHLLLRQGRRASARAVIEAIQTGLDDMGLAPTPELSQLRATLVAARLHA